MKDHSSKIPPPAAVLQSVLTVGIWLLWGLAVCVLGPGIDFEKSNHQVTLAARLQEATLAFGLPVLWSTAAAILIWRRSGLGWWLCVLGDSAVAMFGLAFVITDIPQLAELKTYPAPILRHALPPCIVAITRRGNGALILTSNASMGQSAFARSVQKQKIEQLFARQVRLLLFRSRAMSAIPAISALCAPTLPGIFPPFVANKAFLPFDPCATLGWPLGHPWATLGPPKPNPNPRSAEGHNLIPYDCGAVALPWSSVRYVPGLFCQGSARSVPILPPLPLYPI